MIDVVELVAQTAAAREALAGAIDVVEHEYDVVDDTSGLALKLLVAKAEAFDALLPHLKALWLVPDGVDLPPA